MKKQKNYENEKVLKKFISFARKENRRRLFSDCLFLSWNECFRKSENKIIGCIKVVFSPFVLVAGLIAYGIERMCSRCKLATIMECPTKQIAYSEGDFIDKKGISKTSIIGYVRDLCTKNVKKESLNSLRVIGGDFHMESLSDENCYFLNSLVAIGGNIFLSDKNIKAFEEKRILPNLEYIGGKVLVNAREYKKLNEK